MNLQVETIITHDGKRMDVIRDIAKVDALIADLDDWKKCATELAEGLEGNSAKPKWKLLGRFTELKNKP